MALGNGDGFQGIDEREDSKLYHMNIFSALGIGEEREESSQRNMSKD